MKAQSLKLVDGQFIVCCVEEAQYLKFKSPAPVPLAYHYLPVYREGQEKWSEKCWQWNGSLDKPTLTPSILATCENARCHSYVTDGRIQFLSDCSHPLAGTTHDLLELE